MSGEGVVLSAAGALGVSTQVFASSDPQGAVTAWVAGTSVRICANDESFEHADILHADNEPVGNGSFSAEDAVAVYLEERKSAFSIAYLEANYAHAGSGFTQLVETTSPGRALEFSKSDLASPRGDVEFFESLTPSGRHRSGLIAVERNDNRYSVTESAICTSALYQDVDLFMKLLDDA